MSEPMQLIFTFLDVRCELCGERAERRGGECEARECTCHDGPYVHEDTGLEDCQAGGDANEANAQ